MTALDGLSFPWPMVPLRRVLTRIEQGWSPVADDRRADDGEWAVIKLSAVGVGNFDAEEHKALAADTVPESRFEIRCGNLLLTRANTPDLVGEACVVRSTRPRLMLCDLVYRLCVDEETVYKPFLAYWLASRPGRAQVEADARGSSQSMVKISQGHIRSWLVPIPPLNHQRAIADLLDRRTAAIEVLIAKKEKLLELLREKRRATVAHAVAKGLDARVEKRESGVEWLGWIPRQWAVKAIKWDTPVKRGASPRPIEDPRYFDDEGDYGWVRILDVTASDGRLMTTEQRLSSLGSSLSVKLQPGALFLSIAGTVGKACIAGVRCCIHDGFVYFPRSTMNAKYLKYIFDAGEAYKGLGKLGTQLNLNTDTVGSIKVPFPPRAEQDRIVEYLDRAVERTMEAESATKRHIDLLREYRQALITGAVTGQLDVAALPQEAA